MASEAALLKEIPRSAVKTRRKRSLGLIGISATGSDAR